MRALIDHVERGPVSLNAWSRRRAVPKVCAALRRRDPFEAVGRRRSREVTAHDEAALAAVRVGDAHYEQARTAVCGVPNVVMRQWKRAGSEHVAHQAGDLVGAASGHRAAGGIGGPAPPAVTFRGASRVGRNGPVAVGVVFGLSLAKGGAPSAAGTVPVAELALVVFHRLVVVV